MKGVFWNGLSGSDTLENLEGGRMNKRLWVLRILGLVPCFLMLALVSCDGSARTESSIPAEALKPKSSMPAGESSGPSGPASYSPERKLIHTAKVRKLSRLKTLASGTTIWKNR
jgi:hypothetical protein